MKNIAIITGASSGIGREFALSLKDHGPFDEVWAIARNQERLEALQKDIPFPVRPISLDLEKEGYGQTLSALLKAEKPNVTLLFNASGYGRFETFEHLSMEDNIGMLDLNCKALTVITYLVLPYMTAGAQIVQIASVAAFQPIPYINVYGATKAYVLSFSRALHMELRQKKIYVLALCPFWTKTQFFARAAQTEEPIVKKYVAMYDSSFIVKKTWQAIKKKKQYVVPGFKAKAQVLLVKMLPHSWVMRIWMKQQKLK